MRTIFIFFTAFLLVNITFSQNFHELSNYEFKEIESYKTEQNKVLECINYLFDNPMTKDELYRLTAIQYIMKWMEGTPAHTFEIGDKAMELSKGNSDLLGLYLVGIAKVVLENKGDSLESAEIYKRTEALLVDYCANPENKMKPSKKIKKLIKKQKKG